MSKQNKVLGPFVGGLGVRCDVVARAGTKKGVHPTGLCALESCGSTDFAHIVAACLLVRE